MQNQIGRTSSYAYYALMLLMFADDGQNSQTNLNLSKERALIVANHLTRRGVKPTVVTGFGSNLPVVSRPTEEGREKKSLSRAMVTKEGLLN